MLTATAIVAYILWAPSKKAIPVPMPVPLENKIDLSSPTASGSVRGVKASD